MTDAIVIFHFGLFFALLPTKQPNKRKLKKNMKKSSGDIICIIYTTASKIMIECYTVPEIWHVTDITIFHFGLIIALLPQTARKMKIPKK